MQASPSTRTYAILVDGDNPASAGLGFALEQVEKRGGDARVRLVFGNGEALKGLKDAVAAHGFRPVLQFSPAKAKNTTDVALAIAAMDLLHEGLVQSFCIVSSDSDFHPLATRLREAGREVLVVGTGLAPEALRGACHEFLLLPTDPEAAATATAATPAKPKAAPAAPPKPPIKALPQLRSLFSEAYHEVKDKGQDGWVTISQLDARVRRRTPDFSVKEHGRKQFKMLVAESGAFDMKEAPAKGASPATQLVRLRA